MKELNLRAFRSSNYRLFFCGQLISVIGSAMQVMMETLLVYRLTKSSFYLGIINFCAQWAACIACPFAGVMIDRFNRRKLLIVIELVAMVQASTLALLFFFDVIEMWQIACLTIILGVANAFEMSTRHAFAADLVGRADLASAISLNSVALNIGRVSGPALAGIFVALVGEGREGWGFVFNAITFIAVVIGLKLIRPETLFVKAVSSLKVAEARRSLMTELAIGIQHAWKTPTIRKMLLFMSVLSFVAGSYMVLYPSIAVSLLGGGGKVLGLISGATGLGALLGVLRVSKKRNGIHEVWCTLVNDAMLLGVSFLVLAYSTTLYLSMLAAFGVGFFMFATYPLANVTLQEEVDDHLRGRIISLLLMTYLGAAPLGGLALGYIADWSGISVATAVVGLSCSMLSLVARTARW